MLLPIANDPPGQHLADARQAHQFFNRRAVQVHQFRLPQHLRINATNRRHGLHPQQPVQSTSQDKEQRKAKDGGDVEAIKAQMEKTNQTSMEVFGKIYQQQAQQGNPGAQGGNPGPDANGNVETDYEVHDDK